MPLINTIDFNEDSNYKILVASGISDKKTEILLTIKISKKESPIYQEITIKHFGNSGEDNWPHKDTVRTYKRAQGEIFKPTIPNNWRPIIFDLILKLKSH